jgi:hypothetical protein
MRVRDLELNFRWGTVPLLECWLLMVSIEREDQGTGV